jgi:hypothetical protein
MSEVSVDADTYAALLAAPTLGGSQDADLKFESRQFRIWVPRVTDADAADYGMPSCPVQVEVFMLDPLRINGGHWQVGDEADLPAVLAAARQAGMDV